MAGKSYTGFSSAQFVSCILLSKSEYSFSRLPAFMEREINSSLAGACFPESGQNESLPLTQTFKEQFR
jgi:hypothetical protein